MFLALQGGGGEGAAGTVAVAPLEEFEEWCPRSTREAVVHNGAGEQLAASPSCLHTLRCYVVQCLRKCFLHDTISLMNADTLQVRSWHLGFCLPVFCVCVDICVCDASTCSVVTGGRCP